LYAGRPAYDYLCEHNKGSDFRDLYKYCPCCPGFTTMSIEHMFWSCPKISIFWSYVKNIAFRTTNNTFNCDAFL